MILGIDISSSSTGWALLENDKDVVLKEYNLIKPAGSMSVSQRLYFFGNEIKKVIEKHNPTEIVIEETVLVRSPGTMRTLASFRGVALFAAYSYQKREVTTYEPPNWKKIIGLKGMAKKPEIQLFICEKFKLLEPKKIEEYRKILIENGEKMDNFKKIKRQNVKFLENMLAEFTKKCENGDVVLKIETDLGVIEIGEEPELTKDGDVKKNAIKKCCKEITNKYIKLVKLQNREAEKKFEQVSVNIYSDTGVNDDIADAIGVALAKCCEGKNVN
jgi:Holliday junction resolvasome RuvABC endonuclease subunit